MWGSVSGIGPCISPARMLPSTPLNDVPATRTLTCAGARHGQVHVLVAQDVGVAVLVESDCLHGDVSLSLSVLRS